MPHPPFAARQAKAAILVLLIVLPLVAYGSSLGHDALAAQHSRPVVHAPIAQAPVLSTYTLPVRTSTGNPRLSTIQYLELRDELVAIEEAQTPRAALQRIGKLIAVDPAVSRSCHTLMHDIGREAYRKYRDFAKALSYQDDLCGSGYMHGVVEERLQHSQNIYADLQTICSAYGDSTLSGMCYHGVGHGLMLYTQNNLPLALDMCSNTTSDFAKLRCSEGIFMENFNTDFLVHHSQYVRASDPSYPCANQINFYKDPCYFYAPVYYLNLHNHGYLGAMRWCEGAEAGFVGTCAVGVGHRMMQENMNRPRFVERTCVATGSAHLADCIDGMVGYWLVNFNSVSQGRRLCAMLRAANRPTCTAAVDKRANLFGA